MAFKKAVKYDAKLRLSLSGPAGSGKTWTALTLAEAMAEGKPVAVIDTEHGSASKYADRFNFDVVEFENFNPKNYITAIQEAEEAGYGVLVIDSLSHAWNGKGGLLEILQNVADRKYKSNTFNAWKDITPLQTQFIEAILSSKMHIIATMRSKMDHVQEKNERTGKTEVRKVGMAPVQREGLEYEFDVVADMTIDNTMVVQKSRCPELSGQVIPTPGADVAEVLKTWLRGAGSAPVVPAVRMTSSRDLYELGKLGDMWSKPSGFYTFASVELQMQVSADNVNALSPEQLAQLEAAIREEIGKQQSA